MEGVAGGEVGGMGECGFVHWDGAGVFLFVFVLLFVIVVAAALLLH